MLEERSIWKKWHANCRIFSQIHKEEERFSTKEESPGKEKNYRGEGGRGFFLNKKNKKMVGQQSWALDRILKGDAFGVKRKCIKIRDVLHLRKVSIFFLLYSSCFQQKAYVPPPPIWFSNWRGYNFAKQCHQTLNHKPRGFKALPLHFLSNFCSLPLT